MKRYIFLTILCLFTIIIILVPKDFIPKDREIEYEIIEEDNKYFVYFINNNHLVGIPLIEKEMDKYDMIFEVYKYLTEKSNAIMEEYYTCLNLNSKLITYEILGNNIILNVTENFLHIKEEKLYLAIAQLKYSYKEIGYKDVMIKINGQII